MPDLEGSRDRPPRHLPTAPITLVWAVAVTVGVLLTALVTPIVSEMFTGEGGTAQAVAIVGVVFAEAIALHVCYGALEASAERSIRAVLGPDRPWTSSD